MAKSKLIGIRVEGRNVAAVSDWLQSAGTKTKEASRHKCEEPLVSSRRAAELQAAGIPQPSGKRSVGVEAQFKVEIPPGL